MCADEAGPRQDRSLRSNARAGTLRRRRRVPRRPVRRRRGRGRGQGGVAINKALQARAGLAVTNDPPMTTPLTSVVNRPVPPDNEDTPAFDPDRRSLATLRHCRSRGDGRAALGAGGLHSDRPEHPDQLRARAARAHHDAHPSAARGGVGHRGRCPAGLIGFSVYGLADDASAIVAAVPEAATKLRQTLRREQGQEDSAIQQVQRATEELQRTADEAAGPSTAPRGVQRVQIEEPAIDVREYVMWGSAGIIAFVGESVLIVFFVFFLLASGDLFKRKLVKIAGPSLQRRRSPCRSSTKSTRRSSGSCWCCVIASAVVGVASWIAFRTVDLDQAVFWAVMAGAFNSIPYFGPVLVSVGTAIVAFLQYGTISMAAYVAGLSLVITSIEGWVLMPILARKVVRTNEIAVFIIADLLDLRLGRVGNAAGGADARGRQGVLRSHRRPEDRSASCSGSRRATPGISRDSSCPCAASSGFQRSPSFSIRAGRCRGGSPRCCTPFVDFVPGDRRRHRRLRPRPHRIDRRPACGPSAFWL